MGVDTKIQWADHTFNHVRGCTKVAPECANCYAEAGSFRNPAVLGVWGPNGTRVVASESKWREPLAWDRAAARDGVRRRVFCASLADVFERWDGPLVDARGGRVNRHYGQRLSTIPLTMDDVRHRLSGLIEGTPHLDWLILTKRPDHARDWLDRFYQFHNGVAPLPNLWLGTSAGCRSTLIKFVPPLR